MVFALPWRVRKEGQELRGLTEKLLDRQQLEHCLAECLSKDFLDAQETWLTVEIGVFRGEKRGSPSRDPR